MSTSYRPALATLLLLLIVLTLFGPVFAAEPVKLVIAGRRVDSDVPPQIVEGRTLVPIRVVSENLGATVKWHADTREVEITRGGDRLWLAIGSETAVFNDAELTMDVPAQIIADRTMVPMRFVSETLGAKVSWDGETRTVYVDPFGEPTLTALRWEPGVGRGRLVMKVGAPVDHRHWFELSANGEPRLFIELEGATLNMEETAFYLGEGGITLVRAGVMAYRNPRIWVVLDLAERPGIELTESPDRTELWLDVKYRVDRVAYEQSSRGMVVNVETTGQVAVQDRLSEDGKHLHLEIPEVDLGPEVLPEIDVANPVVSSVTTRALESGVAVDIALAKAITSEQYSLEVWESAVQVFVHTPVTGVRWKTQGDGYRVQVEAPIPLGYTCFRLTDPDRIVIDIPHARASFKDLSERTEGGIIARIRAAQFELAPPTVRVVLEAPAGAAVEPRKTASGLELIVTPARATGFKIAIDPGHGGKDPGAVGPAGYTEKEVNLAIAQKLAAALEDLGADPVLLRTTDSYLGLYERPAMANELGVEVFVSVHNNGYPNPIKGGTETYWYENHPLSRQLGIQVHSALVRATGLEDRGLKKADFAVLRESSMPAVLLECAFMTNPTEEQLLQNAAFQQRIADAVAEALIQFFNTQLNLAPN